MVVDRTLTSGDVVVTITSDEDIAGAPSVETTFPVVQVNPETRQRS